MDTVTWTDDRIDVLDGKVDALDSRVGVVEKKVDALEKKVDVGFARIDERFIAVGERFDEVNRQLGDLRAGQAQMNDRFDAMLGKFAALQHTLIQIGFSMVVALVGGLIALIVAVVATH